MPFFQSMSWNLNFDCYMTLNPRFIENALVISVIKFEKNNKSKFCNACNQENFKEKNDFNLFFLIISHTQGNRTIKMQGVTV